MFCAIQQIDTAFNIIIPCLSLYNHVLQSGSALQLTHISWPIDGSNNNWQPAEHHQPPYKNRLAIPGPCFMRYQVRQTIYYYFLIDHRNEREESLRRWGDLLIVDHQFISFAVGCISCIGNQSNTCEQRSRCIECQQSIKRSFFSTYSLGKSLH